MLGIGEFAGLTGLSVKALRHYDEKGVLSPAEVDAGTGYRRYGEEQVRAGVVIRALRDAGVALPEVAEAVRSGQTLEALDAHRWRVREEREREDLAAAAAATALRALGAPVRVEERTLPAQPYVGRVLSVPVDAADELTDDHANAVFADLFREVQRAGQGPTGPFWTTIRAGEQGMVELVCCWPTTGEAPAGSYGTDTVADVLSARTDLVAVWSPTAGEELPDGYTHPAVVALFDAVAERGIRIGDAEVRQAVRGTSEEDWIVEVSITVGVRS
ncbi:MerR family transcriptional regulator [Microbacterium sp. NPDC057650]|uniref:MerR family transcriptional regulator n=1 Tax=unclassified Microbacterium TaxID=2609290 RepID=UPI003670B7CB